MVLQHRQDWLYRNGYNTARVELSRNKYPTIEPVMRPQVSEALQLYDRGNQTFTFQQVTHPTPQNTEEV